MAICERISQLFGLKAVRAILAANCTDKVLPAYQRRNHDSLVTSILITVSIVYAFVSGYFLGVFQQYILLQSLAPCALLLIIALWALPDRTGVPHHYFERGFYSLIAINILWPVYLAISIPGLPWITLSKLVLLVALLSFGIVIATDRHARAEIGIMLGEAKLIRTLLVLFVIVQFLTVPFSPKIGDSFSAVVNYQFYWTGLFLMTLLVASKPGRIDRLAWVLVIVAAITVLIAVWENHIQRLPWVGHLPSFVQVSDPIVAKMLAGGRRAGDGLYRVQTTYTTSLSYAEFLAMAIPFVIHYFLINKRAWVRASLFVLYLSVIFATLTTRSRLGMIGMGIAHLVYPLLIGIRRRGIHSNDLIGPSLIALYPAVLMGFVGLLLSSHRLYVMFLGGGQHQSSNDAREMMYREGIPMILLRPWGHGANMGGAALGYRNAAGELSIDSYYLSIGLDYGVLGFTAFYGMLIAAIYLAVRVYLTSNENESRIAAPVTIALSSYLVIKSVLSQSQNQFLMFALVGVAVALNYRFYQNLPKARPKEMAARPIGGH